MPPILHTLNMKTDQKIVRKNQNIRKKLDHRVTFRSKQKRTHHIPTDKYVAMAVSVTEDLVVDVIVVILPYFFVAVILMKENSSQFCGRMSLFESGVELGPSKDCHF